MGEVEILINVCHDDLRVLLKRLRPESSERPRAVRWPNCRSPPGQEEEEEEEKEERFNRTMKICFLIAVTWTVISITFYEHIVGFYTQSQILWKEIVMLVMLAPVVAVTVFALAKSVGPPPVRRKEVQTISALVQQV